MSRYDSGVQLVIRLLLLFFIVQQSASFVHAADHPFHSEDALCSSFQFAENNDLQVVEYKSCVLHTTPAGQDVVTVITPVILNPTHFFFGRAPPLS